MIFILHCNIISVGSIVISKLHLISAVANVLGHNKFDYIGHLQDTSSKITLLSLALSVGTIATVVLVHKFPGTCNFFVKIKYYDIPKSKQKSCGNSIFKYISNNNHFSVNFQSLFKRTVNKKHNLFLINRSLTFINLKLTSINLKLS